jgi:hypothetical protein
MAITTFSNYFKNRAVDTLVTGSMTQPFSGLTMLFYTSQGNVANVSMGAIDFGTPLNGEAPFSKAITFTADAFPVAYCELWDSPPSYLQARGPVTVTGGGGMFTMDSLDISAGGEHVVSSTLRVPLSSGGTIRVNPTLANQWCNSMILGATGPAIAAGTLYIFAGAQPANANIPAPTGATRLLEAAAINTGWSAAQGGATSFAMTLPSNTVLNPGTATWGRISYLGSNIDFSVGTVGTDMIVPTTTVAALTDFEVTSLYLSF